jgi:hypothetical protein
MRTIVLTLFALAAAACNASVGEGPQVIDDLGDGVDAGPAESADAAPQSDAGPTAITLSQTISDAITPANSVACLQQTGDPPVPVETRENSYFRVFDLGALGISQDLAIDKVTFGIESASSPTGTQPANVTLYTLTGGFIVANLGVLATVDLDVADQAETLVDVPFDAIAPGGSKLVVEVHVPDSAGNNRLFFIGSNGQGESAPSFLRAAVGGCDIGEPTDLDVLGFPAVNIVMTVSGSHF